MHRLSYLRGRLLLGGVRVDDLDLFSILDVAEAVVMEPLVAAGAPVDAILDRMHQAFYDANPGTRGEGPIAERAARAMMQTGQARPRTPQEIAYMERRKAEREERRRRDVISKLHDRFRAYARNREAAE